MIRFGHPWLLLLALLIPPLLAWRARRARRETFPFTDDRVLARVPATWGVAVARALPGVWGLGLALLVVALARPQRGLDESIVRTEAVDIVLAIDVSTSMRALDFSTETRRQDRLDAAKEVARAFVPKRRNDRIALLAFAALPYTAAPLTLDHAWLLQRLDDLRTGMVEDGTAIGTALASATNRLRGSEAHSKVIVLLTDGINNTGAISPENAAEAARALGVRVYAIGAASHEAAIYPVTDPFGRERFTRVPPDLDESSLTRVAEITGGRYFRATDLRSLEKIYEEIDALERTEIEVEQYTRHEERFAVWVAAALAALGLERLLALGRFGGLPS
jgi:Ca-activated chloride channel family protein